MVAVGKHFTFLLTAKTSILAPLPTSTKWLLGLVKEDEGQSVMLEFFLLGLECVGKFTVCRNQDILALV